MKLIEGIKYSVVKVGSNDNSLSKGDIIWLHEGNLYCQNVGGWVGENIIEKILDGVILEVVIEELDSEIIKLQHRLETLLAIRNISMNYMA
ncbi:MAG: hypothetical protein HQK67_11120 [Desulfamplus sp.]|nr:hypothetical protein [Desulfamplus sp.]